MGIFDSYLVDLGEKVRSWISWGGRDQSGPSREFWMPNNNFRMCCGCNMQFTEFSLRYLCQSCGLLLCGKCAHPKSAPVALDGLRSTTDDGELIKFCKFCFQVSSGHDEVGGEYNGRINPSASPRQSPEHDPSISSSKKINGSNNSKPFQSDHLARFLEAQQHGSPNAASSSTVASSTGHSSPISFHRSSSRSDEEDTEDSGTLFFSPSNEFFQDISDTDSSSVSTRDEYYSFKSVDSSPSDSPSRMISTPNRDGYSVQQDQGESLRSPNDAPFDHETTTILRSSHTEIEDPDNTDDCSDNFSIFQGQCEKVKKPLDFENNGLIWFPPPPDDEDDETENNLFEYVDEDDEVGESGTMFSPSSFGSDSSPAKEKQNEGHKEPLRAVVHGHFKALVSQLLQGEGIYAGKENGREEWLDIVTSVAWQAANFVKPDTRIGGSMDPCNYVKVKCIVSGCPSESTLVRGIVCTKNIKHKRMTSQYKNPRLLLLGGALEYQRVPNQLASFDTLLQQEIDHLKMIVSKIEAHRPNVLLVEKSVSSYAQEYLLAKEISLVLNVKRPLLERIARCTGAVIVPSVDKLSSTRLGHCEIFRLERVSEKCSIANLTNKKLAKSLMFFEGCPRRLGCTVLLKGICHEELKKVKHVVQYAVFAAYHLSLETSFLADEGATLSKIALNPPFPTPERTDADDAISMISDLAAAPTVCEAVADEPRYVGSCKMLGISSSRHSTSGFPSQNKGITGLSLKLGECESLCEYLSPGHMSLSSPGSMDSIFGRAYPDACTDDLVPHVASQSCSRKQCNNLRGSTMLPSDIKNHSQHELLESSVQEEAVTLRSHRQPGEVHGLSKTVNIDGNEVSNEYFSAADNHQSILVSLSSCCVVKGTICERFRLLRIQFYGSFDEPLGRYLCDDLFNQTSYCRSCKEPAEAHVRCYTHQQGSLIINVRRLPSLKLPGERKGKIWMWHRCLKCAHVDGIPPATRRVVMSDAAMGLSFGKFLELSFSNHATANRVASCGHSLQRDCLRYYGFGSMVAFFRYSPIDILSVRLPPSVLEFNGHIQQEWVRRDAVELLNKAEFLYTEIFNVLNSIGQKSTSSVHEPLNMSESQNHIMELKDLLKKERNEYNGLLQSAGKEASPPGQTAVDILELNRLRCCLLIDSRLWDRRLYALDSLLKAKCYISKVEPCMLEAATYTKLKEWRSESFCKVGQLDCSHEENKSKFCKLLGTPRNAVLSEPNLPLIKPSRDELAQMTIESLEGNVREDLRSTSGHHLNQEKIHPEVAVDKTFVESIPAPASNLSDKIDSAWTGTDQLLMKAQFLHALQADGQQTGSVRLINQMDNPSYRRLMSSVRDYSSDSALKVQERIRKGLSRASLHLSSPRSFHASEVYQSTVRNSIPKMLRTYSQISPRETLKLNSIFRSTPSFISSASHMAGEGARLLLPQTVHNNIVITVYDNEPTSIISYALGSKEYEDWISDKSDEYERGWSANDSNKDVLSNLPSCHNSAASTFSVWQSFGSLDVDNIHYGNYGSDDALSTIGTLFSDYKRSPHIKISFGDELSTSGGEVKFSVTCYLAKQFDTLRKKCCPSEVDFIRSLSRCRNWSAQGGKSNVYFAKSLDERFIIKQVTKTELDSFKEFASEYFRYLTDSLLSGSPTCLAKVLGIYQVTIKHLKGGKETKMDLMVMENLFFKRSISSVYDLKGSARSRYNPDSTGKNKVLLDMNLLETLHTNPIFLGTKAKRSLERAIWNDTSFLASVDVMDYSLLVGVDDERKELVVGIIDFMRQYTWDKHLETWVKASGILGGPRNASPTVISPKQYKKRFRKSMSNYFLTVPDQLSS
ncbi:hypothetical protein HHK36_024574 [Tetracentron sinense]|uniref:1-phosphatidylinositol-3-phosphate 5-kinase n=1 Tax=Tetracentron sinense TaxID=13715 RepID=A0A834YPB8_TETSI|nr:hypothetical protein HHK36_024574 [Tetracentron sinense]